MPEEIKDEFVEEVPLVKEEEQVSLNQIAPNTPLEPDSEKKDLKTIFLVIAVTLGLIILVVGGFKLGDKLTGANVADVIEDVLRENGPLTKDEIINKVLEKRNVKKSTVYLSLMNHKKIKKNDRAKYYFDDSSIAEAVAENVLENTAQTAE